MIILTATFNDFVGEIVKFCGRIDEFSEEIIESGTGFIDFPSGLNEFWAKCVHGYPAIIDLKQRT